MGLSCLKTCILYEHMYANNATVGLYFVHMLCNVHISRLSEILHVCKVNFSINSVAQDPVSWRVMILSLKYMVGQLSYNLYQCT